MLRSTLVAAAALALAAAPAAAQTGNQSDGSGFNPTGSGPAGGSFQGGGLRLENEMFSRAGNQVVFRNVKIGCALRGAERALRDSAAAGQLPPSRQRIVALMAQLPGAPGVDAVAAALARGAAPDSPFGRAVRDLAGALPGLMKDLGGCTQNRADYGEAGQWQRAIEAFKAYVHDAPDSAFSPPAPELVAIHDALQRVVDGALHAPGQ